MRFRAYYRLEPSGPFGLPEGDGIVVPGRSSAPTQTFTLMKVDTDTLEPIEHGSLSVYRPPGEAVSLDLRIGSTAATLRDNFLELAIEAPSMAEAQATAKRTLDPFLRRLAFSSGRAFHREGIKIRSDQGQVMILSQGFRAHLTAYDVPTFVGQLREAESLSDLDDPTLERALAYFQHATLLFDRLELLTDGFGEQEPLVFASIYLNLWKGITSIIGDPAKGESQSERLATLGLGNDFYEAKVRPLARARHTEDVAHYSLDPNASSRATALFREGQATAGQVIRAYAAYLKGGGTPLGVAAMPPE